MAQQRGFSIVVLVTLGLAVLFGVVVLQPALISGLVGPETAGHISGHFRDPHHRIHDLTFAFLLGTAVVGMLAQLRAPSKNVAGQVMALIPFVGLVLAVAMTNTAVLSVPWVVLGASTLLAATLHPTGDLFRSVNASRMDRTMLALVVVAAVPLLPFVFSNIALQRAGPSDHVILGHYGYLAAFGLTVIGAGLLASLRPDGWRVTGWVAGALPGLLGLTSLLFPDVDSSLDPAWAAVGIAWGVVFVAATELARRRVPDPHIGDLPSQAETDAEGRGARAGRGRGSRAGTPGSAYVVGVAVVALVALLVVQHLNGGGLADLHTPPPGP